MACPLCDDTGWKPLEQEGVRVVRRCDCWRAGVADRLLADAAIPRRYQHCELANLKAYNEPLQRAVSLAQKVVSLFPSYDKGLLMLGMPGVGKTHLAVAVLKDLIRSRGARGLFYDTRELLRVIRSTYDPIVKMTELEVLRPVMMADALVLDDLGAEKTSEWVEETLNLIVNTRYNERRLTIFTSNYPDNPDDTDPDSLLFRVGFRMRSRLQEMCHFVEMQGADYRDPDVPVNATNQDLEHLWKMRPKGQKRGLPARASGQARADLRGRRAASDAGAADLKWPGGRAGN